MNEFTAKLQEAIRREFSQAILWAPVAIAAGIALYFGLAQEPVLWAGAAASALCLLLLWVVRKIPVLQIFLAMLFLIALGFTAAQWRTYAHDFYILPEETRALNIAGRVVDFKQTPEAVQMVLDQVEIENTSPEQTPKNIRLRLRKQPADIQAGDKVTALAILRPPTMPNYPGGYDFARDAFYKSVGAIGFALGDVKLDQKAESNAEVAVEKARQNINTKIAGIVSSPPERSIVQALISGEASSIPDEAAESLRNSGLYHIISISGLHISFVAGIVFLIVRLFLALPEYIAVRWPTKKIAAVCALAAIFAYTILVGAPVPTQRSTLMAAIVLLAILVDRTAISIRLVSIAATIILLIEPESLLSASFQLSFAAVAALIASYELLHKYLREWIAGGGVFRRGFFYIGEILLTSLIAGLATAPLVIYHFQSTQLYGVLANMVGVPLTGFVIMPMALLTYFLMPFGLEKYPLLGAAKGVEWLLQWSDWVAALPGAVLRMPAAPFATLLLFGLGICLLCLSQTRIRLIGFVMIAIGFALIPLQKLPDLIIAPEGKVIAVRMNDGKYAFRRKESEEFFTEFWLRRVGQAEPVNWPESGTSVQNIACDNEGCIARVRDKSVIIAQSSVGFFEECGQSDFIISLHKYRLHCDQSDVLSVVNLVKTGTAAIFLDGSDFIVETVQDKRGNRPWSLQ